MSYFLSFWHDVDNDGPMMLLLLYKYVEVQNFGLRKHDEAILRPFLKLTAGRADGNDFVVEYVTRSDLYRG